MRGQYALPAMGGYLPFTGAGGAGASGGAAAPGELPYVAWYKFDSGSLSTDSALGNTATTVTNITEATGKIDGAAEWAGTGSQFSIPNSTDIQDLSLGQMTVTAWVWYDTTTDPNAVIDKLTANGGWRIERTSAGKLGLTIRADNASNAMWYYDFAYVVGTWYHIAVTYDYTLGTTNPACTMYFNGSSVVTNKSSNYTGAKTNSDSAQELTVGWATNSATRYHDGRIDDLRIFNEVLTSDQILSIYNEAP